MQRGCLLAASPGMSLWTPEPEVLASTEITPAAVQPPPVLLLAGEAWLRKVGKEREDVGATSCFSANLGFSVLPSTTGSICDVVYFLLVFFLVSSKVSQKHQIGFFYKCPVLSPHLLWCAVVTWACAVGHAGLCHGRGSDGRAVGQVGLVPAGTPGSAAVAAMSSWPGPCTEGGATGSLMPSFSCFGGECGWTSSHEGRVLRPGSLALGPRPSPARRPVGFTWKCHLWLLLRVMRIPGLQTGP